MAGYANKPLTEKLDVRPGMGAAILRAPQGYMELVPELAGAAKRLDGRFDFVQYFATSEEQLGAVMPNLAAHLVPNGMLWVCWAKRTSPLHTGLDEQVVRKFGLGAGLVDVKVVAVTDDWSGLKFVYRVMDR